MKNNTLSYRVQQLEARIKDLEDKIDKIRVNDIPHLSEELMSLKTRINVLAAINIGAIILGIIFAKLI